jgi:outer membrane lipopolysaccharide assembly protein LptE/RlpB
VKTVAVLVFVNRTQQPGVEGLVTRAVADAFATDGRLRVVRLDEADSILEGEVVGYRVDGVAFDARENVQEYRLWVTVNVQLRDVREKRVLWRQEGLQEKADFRAPTQVALTVSQEQSAIRQAAIDLGRAIVTLAIERF